MDTEPAPQPWPSPAARAAADRDDAGTVIRLARRAANLTQTELGHACGYSASTISRIERGQPPLRDIHTRRRIAEVLGIPPHLVGLSATPAQRHADPTHHRTVPPPAGTGAMVGATTTVDRGAPVRRRDLFASGLAAATAAAIAPSAAAEAAPVGPAQLEALLAASGADAAPAGVDRLTGALTAANVAFAGCRYDYLVARLPGLIGVAAASRDHATGQHRDHCATILADSYRLASEVSVKLNDDTIGWVLADRALTAARDSGSPTSIAKATRSVAIAMRRSGHHLGATTMLVDTAQGLHAQTSQASVERLAAYGALLCTAAYSNAQRGDRGSATTLIDEAADAAAGANVDAHGLDTFSATNVAIYKIGIFTALGDTPAALDHASTVDVRLIPTAERRARYLVDTARAWERHGSTARACRALLIAERHTPQDLHRPSVRDLVSTMLHAPTPTPTGLRDLARRIHADT